MREIKFRFWDNENKKWINPENVLLKNDGSVTFTGDFDIFKKHPKLDGSKNVFLNQWTGLCDNFCREIYEGDTLIDLDVELEESVKLEDTQQQVYWCEKNGAWKLDNTYSQNKKDGSLLAKELKDFRYKVFGNIYETKSVGKKV